MKLSIQRETLLKPLQLVTGVVERKHTLPILANILLHVEKGQVTFVGTDLEIEAKVTIDQKGGQDGKTTLPARKLLDIVRTLPEQVMIELVEDKGKATLRAGKSRYTLATLPAEEFPLVGAAQTTGELQLPQKELKELIERTQFAMAQQDVRYYLNGLLLEIADGKLNAVATDGHRLAMCSVDLPKNKAAEESRQVIVPRKAVQELARLLEDSDQPVVVMLSANHIQFVTDGVSLTSKQIDGRFPDYQRVLPKGGDKVVLAEREGLRQSLVRISVISSEKFRSVALQLKPGQLNLHTHNPEQEEADEEVAVEYTGAELQIGFNVTYLQDAISATKGQRVQITFSDANSSCLVQAEGDERSRYVVMPMRL
ncbi:MAG: DNA polymerase III subunit beta [Gammaproteobacteria bacterium]|nr:DNA polymerase III subunit beta [Gammaproteobacteria bacterium]